MARQEPTPRWRARGAWGGNEIVADRFTSLVAGLATTPYAAYHFHRLAPYGVLANLLAMPVVSAWVMPMGILGVLTPAARLRRLVLAADGYGIEWIIAVVLWVASLPGAFGRMHVFGTGPLLLGPRGPAAARPPASTPLRLSGALPLCLPLVWARDAAAGCAGRPTADLRAARSRRRLAVLHVPAATLRDRGLARRRRRRPRRQRSRVSGEGIACDPSGCIGKLADGRLVAYAFEPDAFEEDCARAALIVAVHDDPPPDCAAQVIGRKPWHDHGALALRRTGAGFVMEPARPKNFDRPWAPAPQQETARRPNGATRDATPRRTSPRTRRRFRRDNEADE